MVQSKKFRGVRLRHPGSWVSEIRHPLLKKRLWLGTFDRAEDAARAYDEAAILLTGRNAKTNFPIPQNNLDIVDSRLSSSLDVLSEILREKLRKCGKSFSPSMTCLTLDTESSHIGVLHKQAGLKSTSTWLMKVKLGKKNVHAHELKLSVSGGSVKEGQKSCDSFDEEKKIALEMVEELLIRD